MDSPPAMQRCRPMPRPTSRAEAGPEAVGTVGAAGASAGPGAAAPAAGLPPAASSPNSASSGSSVLPAASPGTSNERLSPRASKRTHSSSHASSSPLCTRASLYCTVLAEQPRGGNSRSVSGETHSQPPAGRSATPRCGSQLPRATSSPTRTRLSPGAAAHLARKRAMQNRKEERQKPPSGRPSSVPSAAASSTEACRSADKLLRKRDARSCSPSNLAAGKQPLVADLTARRRLGTWYMPRSSPAELAALVAPTIMDGPPLYGTGDSGSACCANLDRSEWSIVDTLSTHVDSGTEGLGSHTGSASS
mmetsp:Transcript_63097/g.179385  ORF Transcript_63097/g.179385 Transcript_63097/m.179385 type:complete len:306 (-) Transcript_63097:1694-2611(-)